MKYVVVILLGLMLGCEWQSAKSSCENQSYWPTSIKGCYQCAGINELIPVIDCSKLNEENEFYTGSNIASVMSQFYGQMLEHCYAVAPQCRPVEEE